MERLDRFLASAGCGTRSEVKKYIRSGRIIIDGTPELHPERKVEGSELILLDDRPVIRSPEAVYYLMNKPAGVITATEDRREKTVLDLLPPDLPGLTEARRKKLFPVGRLDKDTEGLLLITDDGALAHELLSPAKHVEKEYYARLSGPLSDDAEEQFRAGMDIGDDKPAKPAVLERLSETEVRIILHEGRYHQVKRMIEKCGSRVTYLKRIRMGNLALPEDLLPGEVISVDPKEIR